jgi:hypothetical protein
MENLDPACHFTEFNTNSTPMSAGYVNFNPDNALGQRWVYDSTWVDSKPRYGCEWMGTSTRMDEYINGAQR